jgi:hypothetical protein
VHFVIITTIVAVASSRHDVRVASCGCVRLYHRPSEYLDRAWGLPQSREARDEEVAENNVVATASSRETPDLEEEQSLD